MWWFIGVVVVVGLIFWASVTGRDTQGELKNRASPRR